MKKFLFSTLVSATTLTALYASATPVPSIVGPLTISWSLLTTNLVNSPKYPGEGKSTVTGSGFGRTTNTVQVYTSSEKTTPNFGNAGLLSLLSNSFAMPFPAGTKLMTDGDHVLVVDHTGTNQVVDASTVLKLTDANAISSGVNTTTTTVKYSSTNASIVQTHSGSDFVTVTYDDSGMKSSDGTTTIFSFMGVSTSSSKSTETIASTNSVTKGSGSRTLHGSGYGTLRGQNYLIQGTIVGSVSGTEINPTP
jgi:hypothetical protein